MSPIKKQPTSLLRNTMVFKTTPETDICFKCNLSAKKCNGECKRYREEIKKLKSIRKQQKEGKTK